MTELKMLNLSTCHIPFNERAAADKWAMYRNDYGWIFWADTPVGEFSDTDPVLAFIIRYAAKREFNYVQLDADGDVNDNLPTFTWPAKADADKQEG
jgi:hypothetical protein